MGGARIVLAASVAAAVIVSGCSAGASDPEPVVSDFGYRIETLPPGYSTCGVTTPSGVSVRSADDASLVVFGDGTLDDPYSGSLYGVAMFASSVPVASLRLGETTPVDLGGRPARLGGADGLQLASLPPTAGNVLTWSDGDHTVQLVVRGDDGVDLLDLATQVIERDGVATLAPEALPDGFVELGDVFQLEGQPRFLFSIDHQRATESGDGLVDQLTLLGSDGDRASMEAFRFRALTSSRVTVGDAPGVVADLGPTGDGPWVVTWTPTDGVILSIFSFALQPDALMEVAQSVRRVEGEQWQAMRSQTDLLGCVR